MIGSYSFLSFSMYEKTEGQMKEEFDKDHCVVKLEMPNARPMQLLHLSTAFTLYLLLDHSQEWGSQVCVHRLSWNTLVATPKYWLFKEYTTHTIEFISLDPGKLPSSSLLSVWALSCYVSFHPPRFSMTLTPCELLCLPLSSLNIVHYLHIGTINLLSCQLSGMSQLTVDY